MKDMATWARFLLDSTSGGLEWEVEKQPGHGYCVVNPGRHLVGDFHDRKEFAELAAAAPELAKFASGFSSEFTVEWNDNGRWRPVAIDGLDGTFANIRAARGYAATSPYKFNRIVHRFVGETEVVK